MSWWRWNGRRLLAPAVFAWVLSSAADAASPREVTLSGNIVYTRDQVIGELDAKGARVTDVTIASGTRIRIAGGHSLNIQARTLTITGEGPVILDGKGEPGLPGAAQTTEPAQQVSPLACSDNSAIHISTSDEYRGLPGDAGGAGAKGANVEIAADILRVVGGTADLATFRSFFQVNVEGGEGGPGGQGGPGRLLTCDTDPTLQRRGPSGFSGAPGQRGPNGAFTLQGEPEPAAVGVAVTISGGISLGSYEAGYNWALVRYIKSRGAAGRKPNDPAPLALVGVTGASAGSINTMLTAVAYCQTAAVDRAESPFDNIFYKAWVPVGLHVLLPADATRYEDADAVLSRKAFEQAERALTEAASKKGNYVPGSCTLPVGMTVTRREPIELKGSGLQAPVDRFSIALEARTSDQGLQMHDLQRKDESPYAKPYLHLSPGSEALDFPIVLKALRASSAFPVAFGMEKLTFFTDKDANQRDEHEFWDGGLYDNIPISLALSFIEKPLYDRPRFPGTVELFAMDPDRRRIPQATQARLASTPSPVRRGLSNLPRIAGNVLSVARKYELQNFIRFALPQLNNCQPGQMTAAGGGGGFRPNMNCINDPLVSSRYYPVYGQRFGAFGAFILESFRQFDFAAGIYDGLYSFARVECQGDPSVPGSPNEAACVIRNFHRVYHALDIDSNSDAAYVVKTLFRRELKEHYQLEAALEEKIVSNIGLPGDALAWFKQTPPHKKYFEVLLTRGLQEPVAGDLSVLEQDLELVDSVIAALRAPDVQRELPQTDQEFLAAGGTWYEAPMSRALRRSHQIEREEENTLGLRGTGLALLLMQTQIASKRMGLDLDPSSVPDDLSGPSETLFHLLPYHLSYAAGPKLQAGWRPTLGVHPNVAFGLPFSGALEWDGAGDLNPAARAGLSVIVRSQNVFLSAGELGPRLTFSRAQGTTVGAELAVYLLEGKIRIAAAVDDYKAFSTGNPLYVTFGFADVNGLLYHAFH